MPTCYGAGETVTEAGGRLSGLLLARQTVEPKHQMEWRLRQIERAYRHSGRETEADVLWLVHEVRRSPAMCSCASSPIPGARRPTRPRADVKYKRTKRWVFTIRPESVAVNGFDVRSQPEQRGRRYGPLRGGPSSSWSETGWFSHRFCEKMLEYDRESVTAWSSSAKKPRPAYDRVH